MTRSGGDGLSGYLFRAGCRFALSLAFLVTSVFGLDRAVPPDLSRLSQVSQEVVDRRGQLLRSFLAEDDAWRLRAAHTDVSRWYFELLVAFEDRRFFGHVGVDPIAAARAAVQWISFGEIVSGASTVTMQVARLLSPRPRTVRGKLIEAARAVQLETHLGKSKILEAYANLAPFGGNLHGVRAASHAYFGKPPSSLTLGEAALLVALPQSPSLLRPDHFPEAARRARDKVLRRAERIGVLDAEQVANARKETIPAIRRPMPMAAPHLARHLHVDNPRRTVIKTTIDRELQEAVEGLARRHASSLPESAGIAVLVVENARAAVRAYVGSSDLFNVERQGALDMVVATRSPGSTLKPFIYGMGFERGVIHPRTVIRDRPRSFAGYRPGNFRQRHFGDVTAEMALRRSLNVPAVAVLDRVGPGRFLQRLQDLGVRTRLPRGVMNPGLTLALGGLGTSLLDLTRLYSGLARGGMDLPLRFVARDSEEDGALVTRRLLEPVSAWRVTTILRETTPPVGFRNAARSGPGRIAFKTGTSYGFRDAWAVGYSPRMTVGIWVGRPDGTPRLGAHGLMVAAPILFEVMKHANSGGAGAAWPSAPDGVETSHSGEPPEALRFLDPADVGLAPVASGGAVPLQIVFPPDGSRLASRRVDGAGQDMPLEAIGGTGSLVWLIDGQVLETPWRPGQLRNTAVWRPTSPGFSRITVLDALGKTASISVRIDE